MATIKIFEGPLCCATGVCDTDPDQTLVDLSADVNWAANQGAEIQRFNLASSPQEFADNTAARDFVRVAGVDALPLVLVDEVAVVTGRYPSRTELAKYAGLTLPTLQTASASDSCCTPAEAAQTGCCQGGQA